MGAYRLPRRLQPDPPWAIVKDRRRQQRPTPIPPRMLWSRMPRFHLTLNECGSVTPDTEGVELPNLAAARVAAVAAAREVMGAEVIEGRLCMSCDIEIYDGAGRRLDRLPFRDMVTITGL